MSVELRKPVKGLISWVTKDETIESSYGDGYIDAIP